MITLLRANETVSAYTIRAWAGCTATDEGVRPHRHARSLQTPPGRPVCRFEEFLDDAIQRTTDWPRDEHEASLFACRSEQSIVPASAVAREGR